MVHELHERGANEAAHTAGRQDKVDEGHEGQEADEADDNYHLGGEASSSPARDAFVPDGSEELLAVRVGHELKQRIQMV